MPKQRSWNDDQLIDAVAKSQSVRSVLISLGLIPAGGNYLQINRRIMELGLSTTHFTGKGWNKEWRFDPRRPAKRLEDIFVEASTYQSYKLKKILFANHIKKQECDLCGWAERSLDGRIPVELDHINGIHTDNRLQNLRVLCPNCHSLQSTHRGRNKRDVHARMLE